MNTGVGCPFPSPEDLPDPGIEPGSPALQADALLSKLPGKPHVQKDLVSEKALAFFVVVAINALL